MLRIYDHLKSKGVEVHYVGQPLGECKSNYVILKDDSTSGQNGSRKVGTQLVDIIFYLPQNRFTQSISFKKEIKNYLKELNFLKYTGMETGVVTDDDKKALTFSVFYEIHKELEG